MVVEEGGGGGRTAVTDSPSLIPAPESVVVTICKRVLCADRSNPRVSEVSLAENENGETEALAATSKGNGGGGVPVAAGGGDVTASVSTFTWGG